MVVPMIYRPGTLGYHRHMSSMIFGMNSPATKFLDRKIREARHGAHEAVVAPESQIVGLLCDLHRGATETEDVEKQVFGEKSNG